MTKQQNEQILNEKLAVSGTEVLYDLGMLKEMGNNEYVLEVIKLFLTSTPADLYEMIEAANESNIEAIGEKAHKIKSSAGIIQARKLYSLLYKIEVLSKTGTMNEELSLLVENAWQQYKKIEQALQKHLQL